MLNSKDVSCAYSGHTIFENVDITLDRGALVVLHGPNGSGKTSFLQIISGVRAAQKGAERMNVLLEGLHPAADLLGKMVLKIQLGMGCSI